MGKAAAAIRSGDKDNSYPRDSASAEVVVDAVALLEEQDRMMKLIDEMNAGKVAGVDGAPVHTKGEWDDLRGRLSDAEAKFKDEETARLSAQEELKEKAAIHDSPTVPGAPPGGRRGPPGAPPPPPGGPPGGRGPPGAPPPPGGMPRGAGHVMSPEEAAAAAVSCTPEAKRKKLCTPTQKWNYHCGPHIHDKLWKNDPSSPSGFSKTAIDDTSKYGIGDSHGGCEADLRCVYAPADGPPLKWVGGLQGGPAEDWSGGKCCKLNPKEEYLDKMKTVGKTEFEIWKKKGTTPGPNGSIPIKGVIAAMTDTKGDLQYKAETKTQKINAFWEKELKRAKIEPRQAEGKEEDERLSEVYDYLEYQKFVEEKNQVLEEVRHDILRLEEEKRSGGNLTQDGGKWKEIDVVLKDKRDKQAMIVSELEGVTEPIPEKYNETWEEYIGKKSKKPVKKKADASALMAELREGRILKKHKSPEDEAKEEFMKTLTDPEMNEGEKNKLWEEKFLADKAEKERVEKENARAADPTVYPFNKKPPPEIDQMAEIGWRHKQKQARMAATERFVSVGLDINDENVIKELNEMDGDVEAVIKKLKPQSVVSQAPTDAVSEDEGQGEGKIAAHAARRRWQGTALNVLEGEIKGKQELKGLKGENVDNIRQLMQQEALDFASSQAEALRQQQAQPDTPQEPDPSAAASASWSAPAATNTRAGVQSEFAVAMAARRRGLQEDDDDDDGWAAEEAEREKEKEEKKMKEEAAIDKELIDTPLREGRTGRPEAARSWMDAPETTPETASSVKAPIRRIAVRAGKKLVDWKPEELESRFDVELYANKAAPPGMMFGEPARQALAPAFHQRKAEVTLTEENQKVIDDFNKWQLHNSTELRRKHVTSPPTRTRARRSPAAPRTRRRPRR